MYIDQKVTNDLKCIRHGINTSKKIWQNHKIDFKILVLAWKAYNGIGPKYISDLCDKKHTTDNTLSADTNLLKIPATKLVTCGDRAFQKATPTFWNDLPTNLRNIELLASFKIKLKTHLFNKYYITQLHKHYSACEHSVKCNRHYTNALLLLLLLLLLLNEHIDITCMSPKWRKTILTKCLIWRKQRKWLRWNLHMYIKDYICQN